MKTLAEGLLALIVVFAWIAGFVLAKGFWSTLFCIIPFWSWYLVVERLLKLWGFL